MTRRTAGPARGGFTMIELLVVILIIAVLVGLLVPAIGVVRGQVKKTEAANEIAQLVTGHQQFVAKFSVKHIPSSGSSATGKFQLRGKYYDAPTTGQVGKTSVEGVYLKQVFPQLNLDNTQLPDQDLDGNQCLVFFLSGGSVTGYQGFSANKQQPFLAPQQQGEERIGPFFDFKPAKLNAQGQYLDPWGTPYAYFSATQRGNDYPDSVVFTVTNTAEDPPVQSNTYPLYTGGGAGVKKFQQPKGFQIVSAGPNRQFGGGGAWNPGSGDYIREGKGGDDLCNFNNGNPLSISN